MRARTILVAAALLATGAALGPRSAQAQLLSPGPLIEAHAELDGSLKCTQCHQLRQRGPAPDKCLSCHAPLRARVDLGRGYHARIDASECGSCHTDHAGRDADVVRFDPTGFDHDDAGFSLVGPHGDLECTSCHTNERIVDREVRRLKGGGGTLSRTYLGLSTTCLGCHRTEDPHEEQFGRQGCESCHANTTWSDLTPFDHSATDYPLTGAHLRTDCSGCHQDSNFRGLEVGSCASCHSDPHRRAFGNQCSTCHNTGGWSGVSSGRIETSFNHRATGFVLNGAHSDAECASCHTPQEVEAQLAAGRNIQWAGTSSTGYAPPVVDRACLSCHVDYHEGDLAEAQDGPDCRGCHTERAWGPSAFDFLMHERTSFSLEGAHQAVVCESCHTTQATPAVGHASTLPRIVFEVEWSDCTSCHRDADPHRGQFGSG
ncbi:MAG: hypothetical protein ACI9OJ_004021, partial [Myxococcota bacterium]